ncbi:hypothetical protein O7606_05860 [Micromonospora sp. WMMD882]|uniref:hypothetical protein n=1 Tax=Micromonospora sp. WMMD882 TaxID=3015151 RepID=UPI00248A9519|nr:hypothetical protein [Micromonospora sp. WMMD882]WBB80909.1 hypothetical protein O7606_05860 [Micromonospora sp. WMMD882]
MTSVLSRAASVLGAALVAGVLAAGSASASPSLLQRFSVPSGDTCTYGYTEGTLEWRSATPTSAVRVTGVVADRPIPNDPGSVCREDGRYTIATYVAYAGDRRVDEEARRVDNGMARVDLVLDAGTLPVGIDKVVIQVCRTAPLSPDPAPVCGRAHTFTPSVISPTA